MSIKKSQVTVPFQERLLFLEILRFVQKRSSLPTEAKGNDKPCFFIGGFISGWSHAAWVKLMPCGPLNDERANDLSNIE